MACRVKSAGPCCASRSLTMVSNCSWVTFRSPTLITTRSAGGGAFLIAEDGEPADEAAGFGVEGCCAWPRAANARQRIASEVIHSFIKWSGMKLMELLTYKRSFRQKRWRDELPTGPGNAMPCGWGAARDLKTPLYSGTPNTSPVVGAILYRSRPRTQAISCKFFRRMGRTGARRQAVLFFSDGPLPKWAGLCASFHTSGAPARRRLGARYPECA